MSNKHPDKPFQRGNKGRPKGSRNKLSEAFLSAMCEDFTAHGVGVIEKVRVDDPTAYLKIVAMIVPKEVEIKNPTGDFTDEELATAIQLIRASLTAGADGIGDGEQASYH